MGLSDLLAKPALPVLGLPVIATLLELLHHHGVPIPERMEGIGY